MNPLLIDSHKSYAREDLVTRAEEGRRQIAMGNYSDVDVLLRELDEDFEEDNRVALVPSDNELELAEV